MCSLSLRLLYSMLFSGMLRKSSPSRLHWNVAPAIVDSNRNCTVFEFDSRGRRSCDRGVGNSHRFDGDRLGHCGDAAHAEARAPTLQRDVRCLAVCETGGREDYRRP